MRASIRFRFTLISVSLMTAMLLAIWAVNNWFLEDYYTSQKLKVMEEAYNQLDDVVMEKIQSGESIGDVIAREAEREWSVWSRNTMLEHEKSLFEGGGIVPELPRSSDEGKPKHKRSQEELDTDDIEVDENSLLYVIRNYSEKNNMAFVMIDSNTGKALLSSARDGDWMVQKVQRYILRQDGAKANVLVSHDNYTVEKNYDPRSKSFYMESWGFFSDNSTLFIMSMPLASIRDSVVLSNRFTTYAGLVVLVLGSIIMYFVTRRVTNPIKRLAILSERMSHLDFEASYDGMAEDEVGILGRSMNVLSDKLKDTIGELQSANEQLQRDIEEKIQIDEMRQKFVADVSHELKTPIALIQGYAEGLTEGMCEDEESRNYYCEVIMDEANKMNQMVKRLLTLSALEFGGDMPVMERFDITQLIHDILTSAQILIQQKEADVSFEDAGPVYVWADEFKIEEVLMNYLNNAMNHLSGERKIQIRTELVGNQVKVSVHNTGMPIPEEDLPNLWTKFYKVDKARTRAYGGSGIGLSIVKAIMDAHHTECGVRNSETGVEFWILLNTKDEKVGKSV